MLSDALQEIALTGKEEEEFRHKLRNFRCELPARQQKILNRLIGGAVAAARYSKGRRNTDKDTELLSRALATFTDDLPKEQRDPFRAMLAAGALSWAFESNPAPDKDPNPVFLGVEEWALLAKIAAALITGVVVLIEEGTKDDPEPDVPVLDLPDPP